MSVWFAEIRTPMGRWSAHLFRQGQPSGKRADGGPRRFRADPVPVPGYLHGQPLDVVREFLSPDGRFFDLVEHDRAKVAAFLQSPGSGVLVLEG